MEIQALVKVVGTEDRFGLVTLRNRHGALR